MSSGTPPGSGLLGTARFPGGEAPACCTEVTRGESSGCRARLRARRADSQPAGAGAGAGGAHGAAAPGGLPCRCAVPERAARPLQPKRGLLKTEGARGAGAALRASLREGAVRPRGQSGGPGGDARPAPGRAAGAGGGAPPTMPARGSRAGPRGRQPPPVPPAPPRPAPSEGRRKGHKSGLITPRGLQR